MKKILISIGVFIVLMFIFNLFFIIVFTYNGQVSNPAQGVTVTFAYKSNGFLSADSANLYYVTNKHGIAIFRRKWSNFDISVYDTTRTVSYLNSFSQLKKLGPLVLINMDKLGQRAMMISKEFVRPYEAIDNNLNRGLDVLGLTENDNKTSTDFDFIISQNKAEDRLTINFFGKGGIQKIDVPVSEPSNSYSIFGYKEVPENEYQKEIEIKPGESYAARLKDGSHYMLLSYQNNIGMVYNEATRNYTKGPTCAGDYCRIKLNILVQPFPNQNLNFAKGYPLKEIRLTSPGYY